MNVLSIKDYLLDQIKGERGYIMMLLDCEHIDADRFCDYMDNMDKCEEEILAKYGE